MAKKRGATQAQGGSGQRTLDAKLLAYCAMASGALLAAPPAEAAVVYSGVKNLPISAVDLDSNGVNDFQFGTGRFGANATARLSPLNDNSIVGGCLGNYYYMGYNNTCIWEVDRLAAGALVSSPPWTEQPAILNRVAETTQNAGLFNGQTGYIGVRFYNGGNRHYGWIQYHGTNKYTYPVSATGTIIDWAYESTPEYSILTGQTTGTGNPVTTPPFNYTVLNGMVTITRYMGPAGAVVIPDTIEGMPVVGIGNNAFWSNSHITSITIPNSVTSIGSSAFSYCTGLTSVSIGNGVTDIGSSAFSYCTGLTSVTIGDSVTSIGSGAFLYCTGLTSITIPNSVTTIWSGAFQFCEGLTSVTIGDSVTSIQNSVFYGCKGLTSVSLPNSLTSIEYSLFSGCTGLTSIAIPNGVTSIGSSAFSNCTGLTSVTIPNSVTSIGMYAFDGCTGLTSVTIPNSVTSIERYLFSGCTGLTSMTIPNSVTRIDIYAFRSCTGLTSVSIPNSVTGIAEGAFEGCTGMTGVTIPGSVTSIGVNAFEYCTGLTSVTIGNSVTSIGGGAFSYCAALTGAYFYGNAPTMGSGVFSSSASGFTVYYISGATGFTNPWYGYPTAVFLPSGDADGDGIVDTSDNCPNVYNPLQLDADNDTIGDVCDTTPGCGGCGQAACEAIDTDGDGIQNYVDNCPAIANPQQKDADADGIGDACDATPGCGGGCGQPVCEGSADTDGDYVRDAIDNCPSVFNPNQLDANGNGTGDCCDTTPGCGGAGQPVCDDFCTL